MSEQSFLERLPGHERSWLETNEFRPESYVLYQFAGKDASERAEFLSDGGAWHLFQDINKGAPAAFLWNKLVFQRALERTSTLVSFPTLRGLIRRQRLIEAKPPYTVTSLEAIFKETEALVVKPAENCRGYCVQFITKEEFLRKKCAGLSHDLGQVIPAAVGHELIVVDRVDQAKYAAHISPASSNTVRIVCMRRPLTREIFIPFAVHRFGTRQTSPLDNFSKGGLSCTIDLKTGRLGPGVMHPSRTNWSLCWHKNHPDTRARIEGVMIPNWQRLLDGVTELMGIFPDLEFVGWDMLPVEGGWCVIEGNAYMDVDLLQVHGGLFKDDRVREFVNFHCS